MIKVTHIITGLGVGGAETMLHKLLTHTDRDVFAPEVISLMEEGPIGARIRDLGIRVRSLGMRPGRDVSRSVMTLARWLRRERSQAIQTWMYHADLLGGLAGQFAGRIPVVWGIRNSTLDKATAKRSTMLIRGICARASYRLPHRIVCCAESARREHVALGYSADRMTVIPNGFDLSTYRPDPAARSAVRQELGLDPSAVLIGIVGRFHPHKDHETFVLAAARLHRVHPEVHFVMCGKGLSRENATLAAWVEAGKLNNNIHMLGIRDDIPRLTAAFDIGSLTSSGEAFPNVLGEAMACAIPCVTTDAGDSAWIVGDTGRVVPRRDPTAFADAWEAMLDLGYEGRRRLGEMARQRIQERFSLPVIARRFGDLYQEIITGCAV